MYFYFKGYADGDKPVLNPMFIPPNLAIGDITELSCTVKRGTFPVNFKWLHSGDEIHSHHKYKISNSKSTSLLYIGNIQASDIGNFTCIVENSYGTDTKTENVLIEGSISNYSVVFQAKLCF